ncbi:MAG: hypothetical protein ABIW84_00360 [Ilumatobacteraceae bacterium]
MPLEVVGVGTVIGDFPILATNTVLYETVYLQLFGTFTAEVVFEGSNNAIDWVPINLLKDGSSQFLTTKASGPAMFSNTLTAKWFRVRVISYNSGILEAHAVFTESSSINTGPVQTSGPLDVNIIQVQGLAESPSDWTTHFSAINTQTTPIPLVAGTPTSAPPAKVVMLGATDGVLARGVLSDNTGRLIIAPLTSTGPNASSVEFTPAPGSLTDVNLVKVAGTSVVTAMAGMQRVGVADGTGTAITSTSAALDENVKSWMGSTTPTVGQKAKLASLPFTLASDQEQKVFGAGPQVIVGSAPVSMATDQGTVHNIYKNGQQLAINCAPVVLPTDQTPIPVTQSGVWAVSTTPIATQDVNITAVQAVPQTGADWTPLFAHLVPIDTATALTAVNTTPIPLVTPTSGAAVTARSVQASGTDVGGLSRVLRTLSNGQPDIRPLTALDIVTAMQGTIPWVVSGTVTTTPAPSVTQDVNLIQVDGVPTTVAGPGTQMIGLSDGSNNPVASSTTAPSGTERGLIVRNIPSGTQTVAGTVTANQGGAPWGIDLQKVNGTTQTGADWSTYLDDLPGIHTDTSAIKVDADHIPLWSKAPAGSLVASEVVMLGARDFLGSVARPLLATANGDLYVQPKPLDTLVGTTVTFTGSGVITVAGAVSVNRKTITIKAKRSNDGIVMLAGAYGLEPGDAQDIEVGPSVNGLTTIPVTCASSNPQSIYVLEVGGAT